jgi:peptidoglycan/LPS O-acetylase OafA/YrhL
MIHGNDGAPMPGGKRHINMLTSLRFFAAVHVLMFHSGHGFLHDAGLLPKPLDNFLANGYLGVSFFFVLSGFILAYVYGETLGTSVRFRDYAVARFARVYPVFLLSLLLMVPLAQKRGPLFDMIPQFIMLQSWPPVGASQFANWNFPSWTLSMELFFYILFPFLLAAINHRSRSFLLAVASLLAVAIVLLRLPTMVPTGATLYEWQGFVPLPLLRLPEFALGVTAGVLVAQGSLPRLPYANELSMLAVVVLMCASSSPWVAPFATLLFAAIIATTATAAPSGATSRVLGSSLLVLLGGASYALYILQVPVREWLRVIFNGSNGLVERAAYYPLLLSLAVLTFVMFEERARRALRGLSVSPGNGLLQK